MVSQADIKNAVRDLVLAAGVNSCTIGVGQASIGEENFPYGEIYLEWGDYEPDAFLVVDQDYWVTVRVIHKTQDEAADAAVLLLPALLNAAGRNALFAVGVNNIVPEQRKTQGENVSPAGDNFHRDIELKFTVRHVTGS